jgi:hypothetical protein
MTRHMRGARRSTDHKTAIGARRYAREFRNSFQIDNLRNLPPSLAHLRDEIGPTGERPRTVYLHRGDGIPERSGTGIGKILQRWAPGGGEPSSISPQSSDLRKSVVASAGRPRRVIRQFLQIVQPRRVRATRLPC